MKLYIALILIIICIIGGGYNGIKMINTPTSVNPYKFTELPKILIRFWGLVIFLGPLFLLFQRTFLIGTAMLFLASFFTIFVYWNIGQKQSALIETALCCIPLTIWYFTYPKELLPVFFH